MMETLWNEGPKGAYTTVKGVDLYEWYSLLLHDYDDYDRFMVDTETIGGG